MPIIQRYKCKVKKWLPFEIWDAWKMTQDELVKNPELAEERRHTGQNIYTGASVRVKDFIKRFRWIHFGFKYKVIVPALLIAERIIGDKLEGNVPPEYYNKNLQVFNDAWEESIKIWATQYLSFHEGAQDESNPVYKEQLEYARHGSGGARSLRIAKDIGLTIALNDTAYREFLNILMFEIAKRMAEAYKNNDPIEHVFYTSKHISDVHYFHVMAAKQQAEANGQALSQILRTNQPAWLKDWDTANENKSLDQMSNYYLQMMWDQAWQLKWHYFRDQVWTHLWKEIVTQENPQNDPLWNEAWMHIGNQINVQVWAQIWKEIGEPAKVELKTKLSKDVPEEVRKHLRDHIRDVVLFKMYAQLEKEIPPAVESMKWKPLWNNAWTKLRNNARDAAVDYYDNKIKQQQQATASAKSAVAQADNSTLNNGKEVSQHGS